MDGAAGPIAADHRALIVAQAARLSMIEWPGRPGTLITVGDAETFYDLARDGDRIAFAETQRGHRVVQVLFTEVLDAVRYLVFVLSGRVPAPAPGFAPGSGYAAEGEDRVLRWPGGRAVSPRGRMPVDDARRFSWAAGADPADIAARRLPLLQLPDRDAAAAPAPPDPLADAELDDVLAAAAEIGWSRRPTGSGDVLAVGRGDAGRVIRYQEVWFAYQAFVGATDRRTRATVSTAASARRLLVAEIATVARSRRRRPVLRVRGPAPGFVVTRGPTGFRVEGRDLHGNFPLGPVGHRDALVFTYCATAPLAAVVAAHRDPDGAPLFPRLRS